MKKINLYMALFLFSLSCHAAVLPQICNISAKASNYMSNMIINSIPSRIQWNANNGYCGEVSIISAGLYYGQYVSQYDARELANLDLYSKNRQQHQILIGDKNSELTDNNVVNALKNMHLNFEEFNNSYNKNQSSSTFLLWVKKHIINHHPVAIGVYENTSIFENNPEDEYDHIVPVFGIESKNDLNALPIKYYPDDVIYFHDNDLYTHSGMDCFQYQFKTFQKDRYKANTGDDVYSLSDNSNALGNYGVAVTGVKAKGATLMPVSLQTNPVAELPAIKNGSDVRPVHKQPNMTLTIHVTGLAVKTQYILYKYIDFTDLPPGDDYGLSYGKPNKQCSIWIESGRNYFKTQEVIDSNTKAIYRVIAAKSGDNIPIACAPMK